MNKREHSYISFQRAAVDATSKKLDVNEKFSNTLKEVLILIIFSHRI